MKLDFSKETRNRMLANICVSVVAISFYFALLHLETIRGFTNTVLDILRPFVYWFCNRFSFEQSSKIF